MPEEIVVHVDLDKMTIGDLETLEQTASMSEPGGIGTFYGLIDRVATIEGVDNFRELPITKLKDIIAAITGAVNFEDDEGNSEGG